jgi:tryptophan synthase alpha chain
MARENGRLPVCIGFGIRTPEDARKAAGAADGVVVGTAVTKCIMDAGDTADAHRKVGELVKNLADGIRNS